MGSYVKISFGKKLPIMVFCFLLLVIGVFLLLQHFTQYGIIFILIAALVYILWLAFVKPQHEKLIQSESVAAELSSQNRLLHDEMQKMQSEIQELKHRRIEVNQFYKVFKLNLFEYDFDYTRAYERFLREEDGCILKFLGALRIEGRASYGIDFKEVRLKQIGNDHLEVYMPAKINSVAITNSEWVFSELLAFVTMHGSKKTIQSVDKDRDFGGDLIKMIFGRNEEAYWVDNNFYPNTRTIQMEKLRREAEEEACNQSSIEIIHKQILEQSLAILRGILQLPETLLISLTDNVDDSFETLENYHRIIS